jgi:hypothetical protein
MKIWKTQVRHIYSRIQYVNFVPRRIFGPKRDKVTGGWKIHNEELHNLYSSPSTIRMIKSRRVRWAGHVGRMGLNRNAYRIHIKYLYYTSLYSLDFSLFTTCFGLSRPSSGTSLRQNCYLHLISVIHFTCNCIVPYLCRGHDPADISQSTIHCDSLSIALDRNFIKILLS